MLINYSLILFLAMLYTAKMIIQSKFCRQKLNTIEMLLAFNCGMFMMSAIVMLFFLLLEKSGISLITMLYGGAFGLISVIYQIVYAYALQTGSSSLTVLIINFSCIVPLIFGLILWNEPLTFTLSIGAFLSIVSLIFSYKRDNKETGKNWIFMVILCFITNSAALLLQKTYQFTDYSFQRSGYLFTANVVSLFGSFILLLKLHHKRKECPINFDSTLIFSSLFSGLLISVYHKTGLLLAGRMNASVYYPVLNGSTMVLCTLASIIILKERCTKRMLLSIILGIIAIILLSI